MQTCYSISEDFQTDNQGLSNSCPPCSKVPSIMRGIGSRVKGHTSVKQNAGEPVRKPTPNRSVLTPSPLTRSGKLNLNNIFPRDAVLLKDFSQGLLVRGIPPAKPSSRLQVEPGLPPYPRSLLSEISPPGFQQHHVQEGLMVHGQVLGHGGLLPLEMRG
jgi:hypothetical protein